VLEAQVRRVSIAGSDGREIRPTLHLLKEDRNAFYLFVCNTGHDFANGKLGPSSDIAVRLRTAEFQDVRIRGFAGCAGAPKRPCRPPPASPPTEVPAPSVSRSINPKLLLGSLANFFLSIFKH